MRSEPSEVRIFQLNIRLSRSEMDRVEAAALVEDRPLSTWARRIVLRASDLRVRKGASA
jgi:hypothetical protein